ncbi:MAG: SCO family protein [Isosphaeraceae bacterium]|nr:SCO family protein [Isosphaeraceae bacterium]
MLRGALVGSILSMTAVTASAQSSGTLLQSVGFDQKLGAPVPLDLMFRDESGRVIRLGDYFGKRPVILTLVYYNCPLLCTQTLNGLARGLKPLTPSIGQDFEVVTVSIDPTETSELAKAKKAAYLRRYGRPGSESGWHFLTGEADSIAKLARAVGFRYSYNPRTRLYAHAAGLVVATPDGRLSRYFYGIDYSPKDLQFGLMESSAGKIGSPIKRLLLFCYDYDAATGRYTLAIVRLMQVLGTATALALGTYLVVMLRRERRPVTAPPQPAPPASP